MIAFALPRLPVVRLLLAVAGLSGAAHSAAWADCQLVLIASLPVTTSQGTPVIAVQLLGHTEHMLMDSGALNSFLSPATYMRLNLTGTANTQGFQGEGMDGYKQLNTAIMEDIGIGHATMRGEDFFVSNFGQRAENNNPAPDGLIGFDIMQSFDIGFDLPDNLVNFYGLQNCATPVLPWPGSFDVEPFVALHDHLIVPQIAVTLDGKPVTVLIDSGSTGSFLLDAALSQAGITPKAVTSEPGVSAHGINGKDFPFLMEEFDSYQVGAEEFDNSWLSVATRVLPDLVRDNGGLIGDDYLAHHRVYLANDTRTAYLSLSVAPSN